MDEKTTKERILMTAATLFIERGYNGVSTADIADTAEVNKALIFYYFGSKKDLYIAVFRFGISSFRDSVVEAVAAGDSGVSSVESFIRNQFKFIEQNQIFFKMYIRELMKSEDADGVRALMLGELGDALRPLRDRMIENIASAVERGEIREVDPVQTLINIVSLNIFFFLGKPIFETVNPTVDFTDFQQHRLDHVIDLIMNGIRKHPEQPQ